MNARSLVLRMSLLAAATITGAASPPRFTAVAFDFPGSAQITPAPQPAASSGFTPAPVPDIDLQFSRVQRGEPGAMSVTPTTFHKPASFRGDGFTPHSAIPEEQQQSKRFLPTAGVNLSVPLE